MTKTIAVVALFLLGTGLGAYLALSTHLGAFLDGVYGTVGLFFAAADLKFISPEIVAACVSMLLLVILFGLVVGVTRGLREGARSNGDLGALGLTFLVTVCVSSVAFAGLQNIRPVSDFVAHSKIARAADAIARLGRIGAGAAPVRGG